jgi:hypothetical protein
MLAARAADAAQVVDLDKEVALEKAVVEVLRGGSASIINVGAPARPPARQPAARLSGSCLTPHGPPRDQQLRRRAAPLRLVRRCTPRSRTPTTTWRPQAAWSWRSTCGA